MCQSHVLALSLCFVLCDDRGKKEDLTISLLLTVLAAAEKQRYIITGAFRKKKKKKKGNEQKKLLLVISVFYSSHALDCMTRSGDCFSLSTPGAHTLSTHRPWLISIP